jgi:hypothetical protein
VVWVVGLEVQKTTCMSKFPVQFRGQLWTPLHDRNVQERKGIFSFNLHCEFNDRSKDVEVIKTFL